MKKWILVVLLYALGFLLLFDIHNNSQWLREFVVTPLVQNDFTWARYVFVVFNVVPIVLLLLNYFVLRIRAKNALFTLMNAILISLLVLLLTVNSVVFGLGSGSVSGFLGATFNVEMWKILWQYYPVLFALCSLNLISGIVISEAKRKGSYLSAEFIYLLSGFVLVLFAFTRFR